MKIFIRYVSVLALVLSTYSAKASVIDFINLIEMPGGYGEGAWNPLNLSLGGVNVSITGHAGNDDDSTQYAYLDWGKAGLGVCKDKYAGAANTPHPGSGVNQCKPDTDDDVTATEYLRFVFDKNVVIQNLWFNNNHDGGFSAGDMVRIDGNLYNVATGYASGSNGIGSFSVHAGQFFDIAFYNEQFYIDGLEFRSNLPEPSSLLIFGLGIIALVAVRKKVHKA